MRKKEETNVDMAEEEKQADTENHNGMFDYIYIITPNEEDDYRWTGKLKLFNTTLWQQQFYTPDFKAEINELAFQSALYTADLAFCFKGESPFTTFVSSIKNAMEREKYFCEKHLSLMAFIALKDIPGTCDEISSLLKLMNNCAKHCFREDVVLPSINEKRRSRAIGNLTIKRSIKEVEENYTYTLPDGKQVPFGYSNYKWQKLKQYIRETDELWDYSTDESSWQDLAGESGVALVRNGNVIADIMVMIS